MQFHTLFDNGRRERLHDAMKRGDLEKALRKPLKEDLETARIIEAPPPETKPSAGQAQAPGQDPAGTQNSQAHANDGFQKPHPLNQNLFEAIKAGDIELVLQAIKMGAELNSRYPHVPQHMSGDCIMMSDSSPLQYAKKLGDPVIVPLLEKYGAKD